MPWDGILAGCTWTHAAAGLVATPSKHPAHVHPLYLTCSCDLVSSAPGECLPWTPSAVQSILRCTVLPSGLWQVDVLRSLRTRLDILVEDAEEALETSGEGQGEEGGDGAQAGGGGREQSAAGPEADILRLADT